MYKYICSVVFTYIYLPCKLSQRFSLHLSEHLQENFFGCDGVGFSFFQSFFNYYFSFNSCKGEEIIKLQNMACFYINQNLFFF